jgi:dolichyl-phosphate-mannose--protein O-mannosyl transferase
LIWDNPAKLAYFGISLYLFYGLLLFALFVDNRQLKGLSTSRTIWLATAYIIGWLPVTLVVFDDLVAKGVEDGKKSMEDNKNPHQK